jgi:hypothetical protein
MVSDVRSQSSSPCGARARGDRPDSLGTRSQSLLLRASRAAQLVKVLRTSGSDITSRSRPLSSLSVTSFPWQRSGGHRSVRHGDGNGGVGWTGGPPAPPAGQALISLCNSMAMSLAIVVGSDTSPESAMTPIWTCPASVMMLIPIPSIADCGTKNVRLRSSAPAR